MQWFHNQGCQGKVADFLRFKVSDNLCKLDVVGDAGLESFQDGGVNFHVF